MERFQSKNKHQPTSTDLNKMQSQKADAIRKRVTDAYSWGVLKANVYPAGLDIPTSSINLPPNRRHEIGEFTVEFDTELGRLSIGAGSNAASSPPVSGGVAYNLNGERTPIEDDANFDFSNDTTVSTVPAKKSSGNINIPLTLTGTSGGCDVNPSDFGTYYVWLEYLEVNDQSAVKVDRAGNPFLPDIEDGYKIILTDTPVAPNGDGISIFLAKVIWAVSFPETLTVTDGEIIQDNGNVVSTIPTESVGEPKRVYFLHRQQAVEVIPDPDAKPETYAFNERKNLRDHVSAVGSTSPNPSNPHGTTLADIPGGTDEPKATVFQNESLSKGIVDLNILQNSPREQSDAMLPSIDQATLTPAGLDAATIAGTGINSSVKDSWIRVSDLNDKESAYVEGDRFKQLYPTVRDTSDHTGDLSIDPTDPATGDGWIGFSSAIGFADVSGTYRLFAEPGDLGGTEVLVLRKELLASFPGTIPDLADNALLLGFVFWDGNDLFRDYLLAQTASASENRPVDRRSLGLVGPKQLSTELKMDAQRGALVGQTFNNNLGNSNFLVDKAPTEFPSWIINDSLGAAYLATTDFIRFDDTDDATLITGGPGALSGLQVTPNAGETTGQASIFGQLGYLKPNTKYGISFFYKVPGGWNGRIRMGINSNTTGSASVITTGSPLGQPLDVFLLNDDLWHRGTLVVETQGTVDPNNIFHFELRFNTTSIASVSVPAKFTNFQVTEGEWIPGYAQGAASGGNIFYDDRATCPPGTLENTNLQGRIPIGAVPGGTSGMDAFGNNLGAQITDGAVHTNSAGNHNHTGTTGGPGDLFNNFTTGSDDMDATHTHSFTTSSDGAHTHTIGLRTGIWCKTL